MEIEIVIKIFDDLANMFKEEYINLRLPNSGSALGHTPKTLGVIVEGLLEEAIPEVLEQITALHGEEA